MEKTIYIIRHGETDLNKFGYIQGSGVDAGLNETGISQAKAFFNYYRHLDFEVVITSKLKRTHQTMAPFIRQGLPWEQFEEINEMGWGIYEGKKGDERMRKEYRNMIKEWKKGNFNYRLDGGESAAELADRISNFIHHLKKRKEQLVLICSHGRAMRCLMCLLQEEDLSEMEKYRHANTGLYKVIYRNHKFEFELENDIQHLSQGEQKKQV